MRKHTEHDKDVFRSPDCGKLWYAVAKLKWPMGQRKGSSIYSTTFLWSLLAQVGQVPWKFHLTSLIYGQEHSFTNATICTLH